MERKDQGATKHKRFFWERSGHWRKDLHERLSLQCYEEEFPKEKTKGEGQNGQQPCNLGV